jgi:glycolate oxidase FAD binding subunit
MSALDASQTAQQIGSLIGADRIRAVASESERTIAGVIVEPASADEIAELVRKCETEHITLAPFGAARTLAEIRHSPVDVAVSLARMNRVVAYEPDDMTVIAEAGHTLAALNGRLAECGQCLPADPPFPNLTTLGSLIAEAKAGPIRLSEGTVRDLLIGIRFVGHGGRIVHGGGQVVKNVAGYDLMKVMTGSFGTLGIITEATFKVRPAPTNYGLALASFMNTGQAFEAAGGLSNAVPLIHLEIISPGFDAKFGHSGRFLMLAGFGGSGAEVQYLCTRIAEVLGVETDFLEGADAESAYEWLRDIDVHGAALVAQMAVLPAELGRCLEQCGSEFRAHAGSGVAQMFLGGEPSAEAIYRKAERWREAAHGAQGHLRILAASPGARDDLNFFDEPPTPTLNLMGRMKATFDPAGIFNPGCFVGGL